ncbi:MAG: type II toxin-antitoxin system RelE/ParE family toxin [Thermodesulfobacteriota bacterium]
MASYSVELTRSAERDIQDIGDRATRARLFARIQALAREPRPPGCEKLFGGSRRYRVRAGDYRILYDVDDGLRIVAVVKVGHRREVYR